MTEPSPLTRRLIADGLRTPAGTEAITDAAVALVAAQRSLAAAARAHPGPDRNRRLAEAVGHLETARHCLGAEQIRAERRA